MNNSSHVTHRYAACPRRLLLPVARFRFGGVILPLVAAILVLASAVHAAEPTKGITVRSLLGKSVAEPTAEKFPEVQTAIERFEKQDAKGALEDAPRGEAEKCLRCRRPT